MIGEKLDYKEIVYCEDDRFRTALFYLAYSIEYSVSSTVNAYCTSSASAIKIDFVLYAVTSVVLYP